MAKKPNPIQQKESLLCKLKKGLSVWVEVEAKARAKWTQGYNRFRKAAADLANVTVRLFGTKKHLTWQNIVKDWEVDTDKLTEKRDIARKHIKDHQHRIKLLEIELATLRQQVETEKKETDDLVDQVFALNNRVLEALAHRNDYLSSHVYHRLIDEAGKLRSQITIDSSDGLRRVRAIVAHITRIEPELAAKALDLISAFFAKFTEEKTMSPDQQALYDLTKQLLVEKTNFKVGPQLYQFLGLELDPEIVPELHAAQLLLRKSLRSEKTESYIQIYYRKSTAEKWIQIKLR